MNECFYCQTAAIVDGEAQNDLILLGADEQGAHQYACEDCFDRHEDGHHSCVSFLWTRSCEVEADGVTVELTVSEASLIYRLLENAQQNPFSGPYARKALAIFEEALPF